MKPAQQRVRVGYLIKTFGVSTRRACKVLRFNRATQYYQSQRSPLNEALRERIKSIVAIRVRYGYRRIRGVRARISAAHFPVVKTMESFRLLASTAAPENKALGIA